MNIAKPLIALVFSGLVVLGFTACCSAPVAPAPAETKPADPTPVDPTPVDPTPVDPTPVDPGQVAPTDPSAVSPELPMCGGIAGKACGAGQFCDLEGHCGATDQSGFCKPVPQMCTRDYRPVCGCDGKTYGNACTAHAAGVSVQAKGPCGEPQP